MKNEDEYGSVRRGVKFDGIQKTLADETVGACNFIAKMIFNYYRQYILKYHNKCPYTKSDYIEYLNKSIYPTNQWLLKTSYYTRLSVTMYAIQYIKAQEEQNISFKLSRMNGSHYKDKRIEWFEIDPAGFKPTKNGFYIPRFGELTVNGNLKITEKLSKIRSIKFIRVDKNYWNVLISYRFENLDMPTVSDAKVVIVFGVSPWVIIYTPLETYYYENPLNDQYVKKLVRNINTRLETVEKNTPMPAREKQKLCKKIDEDLTLIKKCVTNQMNPIFDILNKIRPSQLIIEKPTLKKIDNTVGIDQNLVDMLEFDTLIDRCYNLQYKYGTKVFSVRYNDMNGVNAYFSGMSYRNRCLQMKNNAIDIYSHTFVKS